MFKFSYKLLIVFSFGGLLLTSISISELVSSGSRTTEQSVAMEIENALYTRTEFFGAEATVPFPTAIARERLAIVLEKYPEDSAMYLKLSELDEKLEDFTSAEQNLKQYVELQSDKPLALSALASYYNRRGQFETQAEILNQMINLAPKNYRGNYFASLIDHAKTHKLERYLNAKFYKEIIAKDPSVFSIFEQYLDKLVADRNYDEALNFLKESRASFSDRKEYFVQKQISILVAQGKPKEAEMVYYEAFDPNWSEELTNEFYSFLNENDRFRSFGNELRKKLKNSPTDFETTIRLMHYLKYDGDSTKDVILKLEFARNRKKIDWKADELLTVSIFLISEGNGNLASRFLYSLFLKPEAQKNGELRAKILYQLFELLSDAENERLALTKGDLNFYRDVAATNTNPGITTGILSLIFADENPRKELEKKEASAVKLFNRAAAYRIFEEYKREFPKNPELAQMYLDLVRLFMAEKDFDSTYKILVEFDQTFKDAAEFPGIALKLADAYLVTGNATNEREVYQQILDNLGSKRSPEKPLFEREKTEYDSENSDTDQNIEFNKGINIPTENDRGSDDYYYSKPHKYNDYISLTTPEITYEEILQRYVSSLAKEKNTEEILAVYNREIVKYPDESALYEDFLNWLGQTNFTDEQLKVYQMALSKFQNKTWRDKLARWYIKTERKTEFSALSHELIGKFDDQETQEYLWNFIDNTSLGNPMSFESQLYYALHLKAHERFPHNSIFVSGLLKYYQASGQTEAWRKLLAENYFEMPEIREIFLTDISKRGELRNYLIQSNAKIGESKAIETLPYKLFSADAAAKLSNFEGSVFAYRDLDKLYPNTSEFSERLINFTRSFGQTDRKFLAEAAEIAHGQAEFRPASFEYRTRSGELRAELGDYVKAKEEWNKLTAISEGEPQTFLDAATVFWDYFQYDDAQATITTLRKSIKDPTLYAFQMGAIYEAKHDDNNAITEYLSQLGSKSSDEDVLADISRTKKRLAQLSRRKHFNVKIRSTFQTITKNDTLILNYAHYLVKSDQKSEAASILKQEVSRNKSETFLDQAMLHFEEMDDKSGERQTLLQLANSAASRKKAISYRLQLAEDFSETGESEQTAKILGELVKEYPTNYGVLTEADEFYWRIGKRENSLAVLRSGINLGQGNFKYIFKRKLAARLFDLDRMHESENILVELHDKDAADTEVFDELANIYVREDRTDKLRKISAETFASIKKNAVDSRAMADELADWRRRLINSFTRLGDYDSAVAQHIEIINRQPDDEENVENAIKYVRRYGGAKSLVDYYEKLSEESYKNYRWTVVLARIYEADKNYTKSIEKLKLAIHNQPEMVELYVSLADVYEKNRDIDLAIETIDKVLELTNETPNYMKRKIEILENAKRFDEAEIVRENLTGIKKPDETSLKEEFAEAARLSESEKEKSIERYRRAFDKVMENPASSALNAADIIGYVKTVRQQDSLDEIAGRMWNLREKVIAEIENPNSGDVSKAKNLLVTLDGAFPEAIGNVATQFATGNELSAIYLDIENRIDPREQTDKFQTFALLQNLIAKCGFSRLNEKILIARKDEAFFLRNSENFHNQLRSILNFYEENGDFARVAETLERESARDFSPGEFAYQQQLADVYELLGNREKELHALKAYFESPKSNILAEDPYVDRYFKLLDSTSEVDRTELQRLTETQTPHQIQFINFLTAKGENELAHQAVGNANYSTIWKSSRNAELSLAFGEFSDQNAAYFESALKFTPIGDLVKRPADENELRGDDWFRLTFKYGRWLKQNPTNSSKNDPERYLTAIIENRPKDANEQMKLGNFYLQTKDFARAREHLEIAKEMNPEDRNIWANLGIAYFQTGETAKADETWRKIIDGVENRLEDCDLYFTTLKEYGQAQAATESLLPKINKFIDETDDENPSAALLIFLRKISDSYSDENSKAKFWQTLTNSARDKSFVPKYVVENSLVDDAHIDFFYKNLIERSEGVNSWENDVDYVELLDSSWSVNEAEAILDQNNNFEISEPESERQTWQKAYLEFLLKSLSYKKAKDLISAIEKSVAKEFPRPVWLRLAKSRIELSSGLAPKQLQSIQNFCGIRDVPDADSLNPPSLVRLNSILEVFNASDLVDESLDLRESFYARSIALQKYNLTNFKGLAEVEFQKRNNELAVKIIELLLEGSVESTKETALARIHSLDLIKHFSPQSAELFEMHPEYDLAQNSSLKIAAEIFSRFGEVSRAISIRRTILAISPNDGVNQIELAWLLEHTGESEEVMQLLASVISNRNTTRNERWQAIFVARIIWLNNESHWRLFRSITENKNLTDLEMSDATSAFLKAASGDTAGAIQIIETAPYKSPQMSFLKAAIHRNAGQNSGELEALIEVRKSQFDFAETFSFSETNPKIRILELYMDAGQPFAAIKLASETEAFKLKHSQFTIAGFKNPTMAERASANYQDSCLRILDHLSNAAEEIGELELAIDFENKKIELLHDRAKLEVSRERIAKLERRIWDISNQPKVDYRIDEKLVSK